MTNEREGRLSIEDQYYVRYYETEQSRDEALEEIDGDVPRESRLAFYQIAQSKKRGVNISGPEFTIHNQSLIMDAFPVLRATLKRSYIKWLFEQLLQAVQPDKRDTSRIPLLEEQLLPVGLGGLESETIKMFSLTDERQTQQAIAGFNPNMAVSRFLDGLADDEAVLLPNISPTIASRLLNGNVNSPIIKYPTKLTGVYVEYRPNIETSSRSNPRTAVIVAPITPIK